MKCYLECHPIFVQVPSVHSSTPCAKMWSKMKDMPYWVSSPASCNFRRNWTIHGLASELLWDKRGGGDRMNRRVEINPLCLASLFLALVIVTFLILNPLNCSSSGCGSTLALIAVLLNPWVWPVGKKVKAETEPARDGVSSSVNLHILAGSARLEQELALFSCIFRRFCLRYDSPPRLLRRHKLSELVMSLADWVFLFFFQPALGSIAEPEGHSRRRVEQL